MCCLPRMMAYCQSTHHSTSVCQRQLARAGGDGAIIHAISRDDVIDTIRHGGHSMSAPDQTHPTQHIGGTILVVMMEVAPEHEAEFNRWYNDEHLPERLEIPGYVSARRFKLEEGEAPDGAAPTQWRQGVLKYLCIWEL